MSITTTAHLNFRGDARASLEFYRDVFGGELAAISYAEAHNVTNPAEADQITWGQVLSPAGFHVMAYDVPSHTAYDAGTNPVFISVRGADAAEITSYWEKLVEGSTVIVPLGEAAWAPLYGMVKDRFGVTWVLDLEVVWNA
jgi:PhnB protein